VDKLFDFAGLKPAASGSVEAGEPLFAEA